MSIPFRSLSSFKKSLNGGGARANLFEVVLPGDIPGDPQGLGSWNNNTDVQLDSKFLCKTAALPASNVASIEVPFRGRQFKVAGDRTFDNWSVTIINDEDFAIRRVMEGWMQSIAQYSDHSGFTDPQDYMRNAKVYQLGRGDVTREQGAGTPGSANILAQYRFVDIYPVNISAIDLSYDNTDTIEEFTVDFAVQFWYPVDANNEDEINEAGIEA